jgi:hypothetical protein
MICWALQEPNLAAQFDASTRMNSRRANFMHKRIGSIVQYVRHNTIARMVKLIPSILRSNPSSYCFKLSIAVQSVQPSRSLSSFILRS